MNTVSLEIVSDTICPWCYTNYKRLTEALSHLSSLPTKDATFSIRFSPYLIDPNLAPSPGIEKLSKTRAIAQAEGVDVMELLQPLINECNAAGVNLSFEGRLSNSVDSHRVVEKAYLVGGEQAQRKVVEALFKMFCEDAGDIGDWEQLADNVGRTGVMSSEDVKILLESGELQAEIEMAAFKARQRASKTPKLRGVPLTIINGTFAVSGSRSRDAWVEILQKAARGEELGLPRVDE